MGEWDQDAAACLVGLEGGLWGACHGDLASPEEERLAGLGHLGLLDHAGVLVVDREGLVGHLDSAYRAVLRWVASGRCLESRDDREEHPADPEDPGLRVPVPADLA